MYGIRGLSSVGAELMSDGYLASDAHRSGGGCNGSGSGSLKGSGSSTSIGSVGGRRFGVANGDHGLVGNVAERRTSFQNI